MSQPPQEHTRMIILLHHLASKRIITKQEATDLYRLGKRPITEKMLQDTRYIWK